MKLNQNKNSGSTSSTTSRDGFTLIEILVVIAIIGMIAAVVMVSLSTARAKGRDVRRKADLVQLQKALELYENSNGSYPSTGGAWYGVSVNGGSRTTTGANQYIPGLSPNYVSVLPTDPRGVTTGWSGYLYRSDGSSYKLLSHVTGPESMPGPTDAFYDPVRTPVGNAWAVWVCDSLTACDTW